MTNPFVAKARKKQERVIRITRNGKQPMDQVEIPEGVSPFTAKAKIKAREKHAEEIRTMVKMLEESEQHYIESLELSKQKFKLVDKLSRLGKVHGQTYQRAIEDLQHADHQNDVAYVRLHGVIVRNNALQKKVTL